MEYELSSNEMKKAVIPNGIHRKARGLKETKFMTAS